MHFEVRSLGKSQCEEGCRLNTIILVCMYGGVQLTTGDQTGKVGKSFGGPQKINLLKSFFGPLAVVTPIVFGPFSILGREGGYYDLWGSQKSIKIFTNHLRIFSQSNCVKAFLM